MTKIITVVGARPQFVKAAEVSKAFSNTSIKESIVHTGQHYDVTMSDIFFEELDIDAPAHHLGVGSGSHGAQTGKMLEEIEHVLRFERPDGLLVYGDTNSTLAGALAAAKMHIPVFHVEAGLRSFNRRMPEELNRVVTDHLADLLLCPTNTAVENLIQEGIGKHKIELCGDVMFDSILRYTDEVGDAAPHEDLKKQGSVLVTLHRVDNTDNSARLASIVAALAQIAQDRPVVFPMHPRMKDALLRTNLYTKLSNAVSCTTPFGYRDMVGALKQADLIITDSGGLQKEAFFLEKPSLVLRSETEWLELEQCGATRLIEPEELISAAADTEFQPPNPRTLGLYGSGDAAVRIKDAVERFFS